MALFQQDKVGDAHWAIWKMEEALETLLALLPHALRIRYSEELQSFVSPRRQQEWLSVRVLLYTLLQADKQICYSSAGKPYLADHSFFISISHTKNYVAVMLHPHQPVGIDIEQFGQRVHRITDRFIRPDEHPAVYQGETTWSLLLHWSAKETIYKFMEQPDADLRKLGITTFVPQPQGVLQIREYATPLQECFAVGYLINLEFVLTYTL